MNTDGSGAGAAITTIKTVGEWLDTVHPGYGQQMAAAVHEFGVDDAEMLTEELDIADIAALLQHIASSPRCTTTPLQRSRVGRALVAASHASRGPEKQLEPASICVSIGHAAASDDAAEDASMPIVSVTFDTKVPMAGRILDVSGAIKMALTVTEGDKILVTIVEDSFMASSPSSSSSLSSTTSSSSFSSSSSSSSSSSLPSSSATPENNTSHAQNPVSASSPSKNKGSGSGFGFMCPACQHPNAGVWDFGAQRPGPCKTCSAKDAAANSITGGKSSPSGAKTPSGGAADEGLQSVIMATSSPAEIAAAATAIEAAAAAAFASAEAQPKQTLSVNKSSLHNNNNVKNNIKNYVDTYDETMEMLRVKGATSSIGTTSTTNIGAAAAVATPFLGGDLDGQLRTSADTTEEYTPMGAEAIVQSRRFAAETTGKAMLQPSSVEDTATGASPKFEGGGGWWHRAADKLSPSFVTTGGGDVAVDAGEGNTAADGMPISRKLF